LTVTYEICRIAAGIALSIMVAGRTEAAVPTTAMPLRVPEGGRAGFTRVGPEQTGIAITNQVSLALIASNQILLNGSGVAAGDYDGDGLCDLYFCTLTGGNHLFRNLGGWRFAETTEAAGVRCEGQWSTGTAFADLDGDGKLDLLVNAIGGGTRLFRNRGDGRFEERKARLADRVG
jgi:enediyne biosynthesis protein E4